MTAMALLGAGHLFSQNERARTAWRRPTHSGVAQGASRQEWLTQLRPTRSWQQDVSTRSWGAGTMPPQGFGRAQQGAGASRGEPDRRLEEGRQAWLASVPVLTKRALERVAGAQHDPDRARSVRQCVRALRVEALELALQTTTKAACLSAMRYFIEFCEVVGEDWTTFGACGPDGRATPTLISAENCILADFACYVVENPRIGQATNTGKTAALMVSEVRTFYELHPRHNEPARRPGSDVTWGKDSKLGSELTRVLDGLRKKYPTRKKRVQPILRQHLLAIKRTLDLSTKWGRTKWALYTTAWQGARRAAELVRGKKVTTAWSPKTDMHLGRVHLELKAGTRIPDFIRIELAPSKTDPTGESGFEITLPYAHDAEINACAAIVDMLLMTGEGETRAPDQVPLFGDWREGKSGQPLTYAVYAAELKRDLERAGFAELAAGTHSLRRGAATALAGIGAPEPIIKMIGLWSSNAWELYASSTDGAPMRAVLAMAEFDGEARRPLRM